MAILIRSAGGVWEKVTKFNFVNEAQLQKLIYESPQLIVVEDQVAAVFTTEVGLPGSGSTDLIGVDTNGKILIVETKLARNAEVRRKVIGQVIEYAAYLWRMPFDDLNQKFIQREGKGIIDLLEPRAKAPGFDKEQLRSNITATLTQGSFDLIIAVDEINPELDKVIAYLSNPDTGLSLEALEVEPYRSEAGVEVLVPRRHGQINVPSNPAQRIKSFEQILDSCEDARSRNLLQMVARKWTECGNTIVPGTVGASFRAQISGRQQMIFWAYPKSLQAAFTTLSRAGAPEAAIARHREEVAKLAGFNSASIHAGKEPNTQWGDMNEADVSKFLDLAQELVEDWRRSVPPASNVQ